MLLAHECMSDAYVCQDEPPMGIASALPIFYTHVGSGVAEPCLLSAKLLPVGDVFYCAELGNSMACEGK
jgi:hypothetical protein